MKTEIIYINGTKRKIYYTDSESLAINKQMILYALNKRIN